MAAPGLGLIGLGPRALGSIQKERPGRMYFDLNALVTRHFNSTPVIGLWYAMAESLRLREAEGAVARRERHVRMARMVRAAGAVLGMPPRAPEAVASPTVTPLAVPEPFVARDLLAAARRHGAALSGAMGPWAERTIRVGHVGAILPIDIVGGLAALEMALLDLAESSGHPAAFRPGTGVGAAITAMRAQVPVA
jgi:aspartate aminotransferase-like enzyme